MDIICYIFKYTVVCIPLPLCQDKTKGLKDYVDDIVEESRSSFHDRRRPKIPEKGTHLGSKATGNFDEDASCIELQCEVLLCCVIFHHFSIHHRYDPVYI